METYLIKDFLEKTEGKCLNKCLNISFKYIFTDSRLPTDTTESVFFAISGKNNNGHDYIESLYNDGLRNFVVEDEKFFKDNSIDTLFPDANFLLVKNTVSALQAFAEYKRDKFNIPIIGITGSNGKTVLKEWLYQLLNNEKKIIRSPKSYNSQIGVPLSVWLLEKGTELAIFEAGISKTDEMVNLERVIKPDVGIIINISDAHQENFRDYREKLSEKLKLFKDSKTIIYSRDDELIKNTVEDGRYADKRLVSWSIDKDADLEIKKIIKEDNNTKITGFYKSKEISVSIPFADKASIDNSIFCLLYLLDSGYEINNFKNRFKSLTKVEMRLELLQGNNNCLIINDSYNSDIFSINIAVRFLVSQKKHKKKTVILSDIIQAGKDEEAVYKKVAEIINNNDITRLIGIGKTISKYKELFNIEAKYFKSTEDLINSLNKLNFSNETILLKGARQFTFEDISNILEEKTHETVFEIDLEAMQMNYKYFKELLKEETKMMVMVKAFSYGSGLYETANFLQNLGADYLAVAYIDEGIELRNAGITLPIMVINPTTENYTTMIRYKLETEVFNIRSLNILTDTLQKEDMGSYPIHIKLDTGMRRLGFTESELDNLIENIKRNDRVKIVSVFSHLAASEDKEQDDFSLKQIQKFKEMSEKIISNLNYPIMRHILNSAGIERFTEYQFDMVRLGIGLYGFSSIDTKDLLSVGTLKTTVSQVKSIDNGDTIGYGRIGKLKQGSKIAIVPIGYADGLNRGLGNKRGNLYIKDIPVSIIGNISMDMAAIDISGVTVEEGEEVIVFDNNKHIMEMAKTLKTIPYEILTNISYRVKRVYYK